MKLAVFRALLAIKEVYMGTCVALINSDWVWNYSSSTYDMNYKHILFVRVGSMLYVMSINIYRHWYQLRFHCR